MNIKSFSIDKEFIYTNKHFISNNNQFYWSNQREIINYTNDINSEYPISSLNQLFNISALDFDHISIIPKKYQYMMSQLTSNKNIPWFKILSDDEKISCIKLLVNELLDKISKINLENINYFQKQFKKRIDLLKSLEDFTIDNEKIDDYLKRNDLNDSNKNIINNFKLKNKIIYNQFGTKTGRLTISSGPNILTLKKEYRDIIKSSFGNNGKIVSLDFSSLEVRLLLLESGRKINVDDIYTYFSEKLPYNFSRETIKKFLISFIYGAKENSLSKILNIDLEITIKILDSLKKVFKIDELIYRLNSQYISNKKITNKFGKSIKIDENSYDESLLLNYYLQSNGADLSLILFNNLIKNIDYKFIKPIFIIHDSIVFDCHYEKIKELEKINYLFSEEYNINFPVKITDF